MVFSCQSLIIVLFFEWTWLKQRRRNIFLLLWRQQENLMQYLLCHPLTSKTLFAFQWSLFAIGFLPPDEFDSPLILLKLRPLMSCSPAESVPDSLCLPPCAGGRRFYSTFTLWRILIGQWDFISWQWRDDRSWGEGAIEVDPQHRHTHARTHSHTAIK